MIRSFPLALPSGFCSASFAPWREDSFVSRRGAKLAEVRHSTLVSVILCLVFSSAVYGNDAATPDFNTHVAPILAKYCTGCHAGNEAEGKLALEDYEHLMQGGRRGPAVVAGRSEHSRLVLLVEGRARPVMPPEGNERPTDEEIAVLKSWIDAGAKSPTGAAPDRTKLTTPQVPLLVETPLEAINAAAYSPDGKWIAVASYSRVRLLDSETLKVAFEFSDHRGHVNDVCFSPSGRRLLSASGEPGLFGELRLWNVDTGKLQKSIVGHRDALYAAAFVAGGPLLVSGSYDEQLRLWDRKSGHEQRTLEGHNGPVFAVSVSPDGRLLASASGDRTVKIWDVPSGQRLDTLSQPLKELYAVAFSADGQRLAAGGADSRIRVWQIGKSAREGENVLLHSRFAHEGAIVRLAYSPDGRFLASAAENRSVKIWDAVSLVERHVFNQQSDIPAAIAFSPDSRWLFAGRLDGSYEVYDVEKGRPRPAVRLEGATPALILTPAAILATRLLLADEAGKEPAAKKPPPLPKPELTSILPRGVQRGVAARVKLVGKHLAEASEIKTSNKKLTAKILDEPAARADWLSIELTADEQLPPGPYEISVTTPAGTSGKVKLYVDDLVQHQEAEPNNDWAAAPEAELPASLWGALTEKGDIDAYRFRGQKGETILFDLAAQSLGSKLNGVLTIVDEHGHVLAANNDFDGQNDPLIAFTLPAEGSYLVRVSDLMLSGSAEHFYRLSAGKFPYVTACYPLSLPAGAATEVELIGYNLPPDAKVKVTAGAAGEVAVPIDLEGHRSRRPLKVAVGDLPEVLEIEPNDSPAQANLLSTPCTVNGRIRPEGERSGMDLDLFQFTAIEDQVYVIETDAARRGSPIDTRIEVLDEAGRPVERMLLQATRDSYVTFRPIDSQTIDVRVKNWEEMELNEFLYMQGEVCKLFRLPQGPDSGFNFYARAGKRRAYFDTSPTTHALDEPCYTVEPHPPGTSLVPNGLPVFTLYYANDDEADRKLGSDSRLIFTAPASGKYLMRVRDVREQGGDRYAYRLTIRQPKPDFNVALGGASPTINAGSGKGFTLTADRSDGFDDPIQIEVRNLPSGYTVSQPLVIEAGHLEAKGVLHASAGAAEPTAEELARIEIVASALIHNVRVERKVGNFGTIKLIQKTPPLTVHLEPAELTIAPGTTITATLRVQRNDFIDRVQFSVDNLPHGVIVDNIGLNGVLIPEGQTTRQIFLTARSWVPETTRPFHAVANNAGAQASSHVMLTVRKASQVAQAPGSTAERAQTSSSAPEER